MILISASLNDGLPASSAALTQDHSTMTMKTAAKAMRGTLRLAQPVAEIMASPESQSHRGVAAVDEQQGAGHVRGVVGGEKQDARGDLIGCAVTPEQGALGGVIAVLLERPADRLIAVL